MSTDTNSRCPFDFTTNCSRACAWYNKEHNRCIIPLSIYNLTAAVKENSEIVRGVAGSLRSIIKENKNDFSK